MTADNMTADNMTADNMTVEGELGADSPMFTAAALTLIVLAVFQVHYLSGTLEMV